jgi:outer membrane lipase/esterase
MTVLLSKLNLMRAGLATVALALLASCGGGDQIEPFVPNTVVAFGDEASLIEEDPAFPDDGRKYTVNGVERASDGTTLTSTRDCTRNLIWVQVVANDYGYQFAECLTTATTARAFTRAQANSTVAMMSARITAYMTSPGFTGQDLVTIMVGTYDVLAAAAEPTRGAALAAATAAGTAAGAEVVRITERGPRVIVSTIPDVGVTPQGIASGQAVLLSELTTAFNNALRSKLQDVRGGGHSAGLVLGDELVLAIRRSPSSYGIANIVDAACVNALPDCDETDPFLVTAARTTHASDWLWAGPLQLGANAQARLGSAAVYRARNNPF